jgi:hypothetical protein
MPRHAPPAERERARGGCRFRSAWQSPEQRVDEAEDRVTYRPYQEEILAYVRSLPEHKNITLATGTAYCYADKPFGSEGKRVVVCDKLCAITSALVIATGSYEVTAGKAFAPFDVSAVTNGLPIVHSSAMTQHQAVFDKARTKYIVGASKAAIDMLQSLDPDDASIVWAHRGHIIFTNRDQMAAQAVEHAKQAKEILAGLSAAEVARMGKEARAGYIKGTNTANLLLKAQKFSAYQSMFVAQGRGLSVSEPLSGSGVAQRGGIESIAGIEHARRFLPREKQLTALEVVNGALHLKTRGAPIVPTAEDIVVLCTGQRAEGFGKGYHRACAVNNADGIFTPFAVSGTATCLATYWTHLVVAYLDGTANAYSDGRLKRAAHGVADHMEQLKDKSPWACFMTYLGTNQLEVAHLIFPWEAVGSGDLTASSRWVEWYGRDLNVRAACKTLSAAEYEDAAADTGTTVDATAATVEQVAIK